MKPEKIRASFHSVAGVLATMALASGGDKDVEGKIEAFRAWGEEFATYVAGQNTRIDDLEKTVHELTTQVEAMGDGLDELETAVTRTANAAPSGSAPAPAATAAYPAPTTGPTTGPASSAGSAEPVMITADPSVAAAVATAAGATPAPASTAIEASAAVPGETTPAPAPQTGS